MGRAGGKEERVMTPAEPARDQRLQVRVGSSNEAPGLHGLNRL